MADKLRERNYVDAFSDYGMDERQTAIQNKIMTKCFKILFYGVTALSAIFLCAPILTGIQIPVQYAAVSYFLLAVICSDMYIIQASKHGAINGITAFGWTGKGHFAIAVFYLLVFLLKFIPHMSEINFGATEISMIIILITAVVSSFVKHFCGKRNFKVMDEKSSDDTEDNEEE